jgi:cytochrome c peroxidase
MVAYELDLYTAQVFDHAAGELFAAGGQGGPEALSDRIFVFEVNDPLGCDPAGATCTVSNPDFTSIVFTEYAAWGQLRGGGRNAARSAVARGQDLFNTLVIPITAVAGINDDFGGRGTSTCRSWAPAPRVTTRPTSATTPCQRRSTSASLTRPSPSPGVATACTTGSVFPSATCRSTRSATSTSGELKVVSDPGRALITGRWKDVGRFKGPILRGLAGRGPYFHNGSAATLLDVVSFYDRRFNLGLSEQQKAEIVAFLRTL